MTKPILEWAGSYGRPALLLLKGLLVFPIYALTGTPFAFYFVVTGRFELAWAEIQDVFYRSWPQWFDQPDTFARKLARLIVEL